MTIQNGFFPPSRVKDGKSEDFLKEVRSELQ
jgi:hypothetical protein